MKKMCANCSWYTEKAFDYGMCELWCNNATVVAREICGGWNAVEKETFLNWVSIKDRLPNDNDGCVIECCDMNEHGCCNKWQLKQNECSMCDTECVNGEHLDDATDWCYVWQPKEFVIHGCSICCNLDTCSFTQLKPYCECPDFESRERCCEVKRCDTCVHWSEYGFNREGDCSGLSHRIVTAADFSCANWKEKGPFKVTCCGKAYKIYFCGHSGDIYYDGDTFRGKALAETLADWLNDLWNDQNKRSKDCCHDDTNYSSIGGGYGDGFYSAM